MALAFSSRWRTCKVAWVGGWKVVANFVRVGNGKVAATDDVGGDVAMVDV
jgi:hypothetical protein